MCACKVWHLTYTCIANLRWKRTSRWGQLLSHAHAIYIIDQIICRLCLMTARTLKTPLKERNKQEKENFTYFILIIFLSNVLNLNVPEEGYSRNAMRTTFDIYISITNTGYYQLKLKVLGVCDKIGKVPKHDNVAKTYILGRMTLAWLPITWFRNCTFWKRIYLVNHVSVETPTTGRMIPSAD